ncbi:MAG: SDR family NAD(P)-dependent oxidoreductase [Candidatus Promineifilaceae bacterium]
MQIDLTGKTAVVTGGNRGIGRSFANALAECGAQVVITTFSSELQPFADEKISGVHLDATDSAQVTSVMADAAATLGGKIDILINNAGGLLARVETSEMSDEHFHNVVNVNFSSAFYCTREALKFMPDGGRIINLSSLAAHDGGGGGSRIYAATKGAINSFTRGMAKELAPRNITVNAISPGFIADTPFHNTFTPANVQDIVADKTLIKRGGTPDEVAYAALYLVSQMGTYVTGEIMEINGGLYFV